MTTPAEAFAELKGRLDALEWAFFEITGRTLIIEHSDDGNGLYRFDDGSVSNGLPVSVDYAQTCVSRELEAVKESAASR